MRRLTTSVLRGRGAAGLFLVFASQGVAALPDAWYLEPSVGVALATRLNGDNDVTEQASILGLKAEYDAGGLRFTFEGDYRYDSAFDSNERYSDAAAEKYRSDGRIEQGYLGWDWREWGLTLGYQKVAWGEADDLRIVDVVNPLDLQHFVLFDLDEYRIAQKMLRAEGWLNDEWELELLWLFEFEPNKYAPPGSEFAAPLIPQASESRPNGSELGFRTSSIIRDADVSLYGFYGFEDAPVFLQENAELRARYERQLMLGASFNLPVQQWVIRGESAVFPNRNLSTDQGAKSEHHVVQALLGVDYLYQDWTLGAQVADRYIESWSSELTDSERDTVVTASVEGTSLAATLTTRVAVTSALASGGGVLSQLKLTYQPNRHWTWRFAIDVMDGSSRNFFGQFSERDRVWSSLTYTF